MKLRLFGIFLLTVTAVFVLSSCFGEPAENDNAETKCNHVEFTDAAVQPTCTEDGKSEGKHCSLCGEIFAAQETVEKLGHDEAIFGYVAATCASEGSTGRKYCLACGEDIAMPRLVDKLPHTEIHIGDSIAPTCKRWGLLERVECSVCGEVIQESEFVGPTGHSYVYGKCEVCNVKIKDYSNLDLYVGNEGYTFFATQKKENAMRALYDEMAEMLSDFHSDPEWNAVYFMPNNNLGGLYTVALFDYAKHGLTLDEAKTVYGVFRKDYPIFYWMTYWLYWDNTNIRITTVKEYANGADRVACNELIYEGIERYIMAAEGESDAYNIALVFYDEILKNNSYANDLDGKPVSKQWAHSIAGAFTHGGFVCEGYAKLFQLLLNVSCIENIFVVGDTSGEHCWNLVRMDDGGWYWFDPTWGDSEKDPYKYFCVTDSAMKTHTPETPGKLGMYFNGELPPRAEAPYESDSALEIGERFTVGESEYFLCAAGAVKLKKGTAPTADKLAYNGRVYSISK